MTGSGVRSAAPGPAPFASASGAGSTGGPDAAAAPHPDFTATSGDTWGVAQRVISSSFIGRRQELAELERTLADAAAGRPKIVFLAGESGVGKTRLLSELIGAAEQIEGRALGGACIELGEDELPYAPLVAALRPLQRGDDPTLAELPDVNRAELSRLIPELGEPSGERESERGEAQRRLFDAFLELIAKLGAEQPLLLWIEDIHWADRSTRSFLRFLEASLSEERVLVLATYRSDELHRRHPLRPLIAELERSPCAERIQLERFDRDELADQLADILGAAPAGDVVERMYGRSDGNPLFTEELLAAGIDARGPLPPSLREALLLRVERLPDSSQQSLRALAVVGRADHDLLADAAGIDGAALSAAMREAIAAQIVVVDEGGLYGFRHALLREVIYDDLLPGERAELHLSLAHALERAAAEGHGAWTTTGIAHHYYAAGDQPRALTSALTAAQSVQGLHAYGEAAGLLDRALELWARVPDPEALTGIDQAEVLIRAGRAHYLDGEDEIAGGLYGRAESVLDESADPERLASVLAALAGAQWGLGQADRSRATQRRALELPTDTASPVRAQLLAQRLRFLALQSRFSEVRDEAPEALAAADRSGFELARGRILNRLGYALFALGDPEEGAERLRESIEIAQRAGNNDDLATGYVNWADSLHYSGRSAEGMALLVEGQARVAEEFRASRWLHLTRAEIAFDLGDWEECAAQIDDAGTLVGGMGRANERLCVAELTLGRGDDAAARQALEEADALLVDALEPQYIAILGALMAELERRAGNLDAARAAVDTAIDRIQFCSEDAARVAMVAASAVMIEAEAAERARDLGDQPAIDNAQARAESLAELVRAAAEDSEGVVERAYTATADAELARARGEDDAAQWAEAVSAWELVERPYPRAIARWRQAQAELGAGERDAAAASIADAIAEAQRLGASWLAAEAKGLAARGRLSLTAAGDGTDDDAETAAPEPFGLTPRERQVLTLVASGATNREIAAELFMAEKTASVHVSRILTKLDVRSRTEAAAVAYRHGIAAEAEPEAETA